MLLHVPPVVNIVYKFLQDMKLILMNVCLLVTRDLAGVGWRGGLVVGRRTCDLVVAGSRPGRDAAA